METKTTRPYDRLGASRYLEEKHSIKHNVATLAGKAVRGDGPAFFLIGRKPFYWAEDLDDYAASITSKKVRSTSELRDHKASVKRATSAGAAIS